MLELIMNNAMIWGGGGLVGIIVAYILKIIPNDVIQAKIDAWFDGIDLVVGGACKAAGIVVTLGLSRWPYTKGLWNSLIEPWIIDAIDNIVMKTISRAFNTVIVAVAKFVEGMRSDNK